MNIGIDIDGTLTDEHSFLIKKGLEFIEKNNLNYKLENADEFNTIDIFNWGRNTEIEFWRNTNEIFEYAKNIEILPNATEVINKLKNNNKIFIITSREFGTEENEKGTLMRKLVKEWLEKYDISYDKIIFSKDNKVKECIENNIELIIEDSPRNIEKLKDIVKTIICIDAPYNKHLVGENIVRCKNWEEIGRVLF